ncbi:MAG: phosphoribosylglycinamide formyltransferase [Candidatus Goldiibacteriota bacterium]
MKNIAVFVSGGGTNLQSLLDAVESGAISGGKIVLVFSNKKNAYGLERAKKYNVHTLHMAPGDFASAAEYDRQLASVLNEKKIGLVCLAGYMRLLSPQFIAAFPNRILNIHPSLLPAFPGLDAQRQAFEHGVKIAGCTVHFVDDQLDHGVIVLQRAIPVLDGDDAHTLAERILAEEHIAYTEAIARVSGGEYEIRGRRFVKRAG